MDGGSFDTDIQTVPDLFTFIDDADRPAGPRSSTSRTTVDLGYPRQIEVDYTVDAIDDEACYPVKNFESLEAME